MNFREIRPSRNRSKSDVRDIVRISFPKIKTGNTMIMYIGKNIAEQIGIHGGEKVKFYVDDHNPRIWFFKKSDDDIGYKILDIDRPSGKKSDVVRMQMTWKEFKPEDDEISLRTVKHDFIDGGVRLILKQK